MKFKKTTLKNGLRIITVPMKGNATVAVYVMVETGSNYETKEQNGLSHFLEHMCFKGTTKRPTPLDVALEFDRIGAEHNAFTANEYTGYYAKAAKKHWQVLLDVLSDMYKDPKLDQGELDKERGVILQEISMYEDLPHRQVQELIGKLMYGDTPAGRPVIGLPKNVKTFTREDFLAYRKSHYTPERTIVVVSGDVSPVQVKESVSHAFGTLKQGSRVKKGAVLARKGRSLGVIKKVTEQMHLVLGFPAYSGKDKRATALNVLCAILSGGMSGRLFKKLRTDMGACYYVYASTNEYSNYGDLTISIGFNESRLGDVFKALLEECHLLTKTEVPLEELEKAKEFLVSHLYLRLETTDALADFYAGEEVVRGRSENPKDIESQIRRITLGEIKRVAQDVFKPKRMSVAIVGNIKEAKAKQILKL